MISKLFNTYKNVIIYIIKFTLLYIFFVLIYNKYLSFYKYKPDFFTSIVAKSVNKIYHLIGISSSIEPFNNTGLKLIINNEYIARIVEGCSAASIIILFVVFIISFGKTNIKTFVFLLLGAFSIFIINIFRILFLAYTLYAFPDYQKILHQIIFPAIIYTWVVLLWIYFIKKIYKK